MINVDITAKAFYQPLPVILMAIKVLRFRTPGTYSEDMYAANKILGVPTLTFKH